jgi:Mrp family chromosome partitioning ATPase
VLAALALARFSPRLRSRYDVADKVGLNTLLELPGTRTKGPQLRREQRLRQLTNILRARLAGPGVVAVTQATDGAATRVVARGLAMEWATQGYATVLVRLGGGIESLPSRIDETTPVGPVEASAALSRIRAGPVPGMSILDMRPGLVRGTPRLPAMKVTELLELEQLVGAFIIIEAPAVIASADAQAASLAADVTILVIDTQVAKVPETREAVGVLRQPGVVLLGAVLAPVRDEEVNPDGSDLDEGNGHQPRFSGLDTWLLAPWASPTAGVERSWSPTSIGSADSSKPARSLPDDVTSPAQDVSLTLLPAVRARPTGGSAPRRNGSISESERSA